MLRQMDKPVWMRFAVIPGVNDDPAHVEALAEFAASFPDLERVDVIPFQRMAANEWRKRCPLPGIQALEPAARTPGPPDPQYLQKLRIAGGLSFRFGPLLIANRSPSG